MTTTVDLVIIGSGPAGLSTALHLVQLDPGWANRMLLLERAVHPRPKLCGGGVTRLGLNILADLGINFPLPLPQTQVEDVRLRYEARTIHVHGQPQFVIFHRPELDAYLVEQARQRGILICENETAKSIEVLGDSAIVRTDKRLIHAQIVVGADGIKGVVRRLFHRPGAPSRTARLLEVLATASESEPHFTDHFAVFDFTSVRELLQGYIWEFPVWVNRRAHLNRGIYDARLARRRPRADLLTVLDKSFESINPDSALSRVEGHPIHWFSPRNRISMARVLLVGDAAGVDPLFGEGIAPAFGYGQVAAEAIQQAFVKRDFRFKDFRWRLLRSKVGKYLLLRWCIAWWSYRLSGKPWFMRIIWTIGQVLAALWPHPQPLTKTKHYLTYIDEIPQDEKIADTANE